MVLQFYHLHCGVTDELSGLYELSGLASECCEAKKKNLSDGHYLCEQPVY